MPLRSHQGQGLYAASEWSEFVGTTQAWAATHALRGLLHLHGHTTVTAPACACRDYVNPDLLSLSSTIANVYPFLSIDAGGGTNWGYTNAVARTGDGFTYLTGTWGAKTDKILLWGDSMGALGCLNWAKQNPTKVAAVVLTRPVLDLVDMVNNNRGGFAAEINSTYGGTYNDATQGPTYNPNNYGAALNGIPIQIFYGGSDTIAVPAAVTTFLGLCASAAATSVGAVDHASVVTNIDRSAFMAFLAAHA